MAAGRALVLPAKPSQAAASGCARCWHARTETQHAQQFANLGLDRKLIRGKTELTAPLSVSLPDKYLRRMFDVSRTVPRPLNTAF